MTSPSTRRLVLLGLALLAVFSIVFTQIAQAGRWPATPSGFLHDSDLWIGLAAGIVLLLLSIVHPDRSDVPRP